MTDFAALHRRGDPLVLPTVWDVESARRLVEAGFPAARTRPAAPGGTAGGHKEVRRRCRPRRARHPIEYLGNGQPCRLVAVGSDAFAEAERRDVPPDQRGLFEFVIGATELAKEVAALVSMSRSTSCRPFASR